MEVGENSALTYIEWMFYPPKATPGVKPPVRPANILTVERTTKSKYVFSLLVRAVTKKTNIRPRYFQWEKQKGFEDGVKGLIEEHSLFGTDHLYVLEGFSLSFVEKLAPPPGTYIVAETTGGDLKVEPYTSRKKRDILRVLLTLMGPWECEAPTAETDEFDGTKDQHRIKWESRKVQLSKLLKLDWTSIRDYEEFEAILNKAKLMNWREKQIGDELMSYDYGNLLTLIKRSDFKKVFDMMRRNGANWLYNRLVGNLGELIHYRSLRLMGYDEDRAAKELDVGYRRKQELEEATKMLTGDDIKKMAQRIVDLDLLLLGQKELGLQLLLLNAPIRIKK